MDVVGMWTFFVLFEIRRRTQNENRNNGARFLTSVSGFAAPPAQYGDATAQHSGIGGEDRQAVHAAQRFGLAGAADHRRRRRELFGHRGPDWIHDDTSGRHAGANVQILQSNSISKGGNDHLWPSPDDNIRCPRFSITAFRVNSRIRKNRVLNRATGFPVIMPADLSSARNGISIIRRPDINRSSTKRVNVIDRSFQFPLINNVVVGYDRYPVRECARLYGRGGTWSFARGETTRATTSVFAIRLFAQNNRSRSAN